MTRIFTTGAEEMNLNGLWDQLGLNIAGGFTGMLKPGSYYTATDTANVAFAPRTGRSMYLLTSNMFLRKDFGAVTSNTELYFGLAVRVPYLATGEFLVAYTDDPSVYSNRLALRLNANGAVEVVRSGTLIANSNSGIVSVNTWHYYEVYFKPADSGGRAVVYVDGVLVIDFTGDTTAEEQYINAWQISGVETSTARPPTAFDDIVVNDPNGAVNNTFPGMVRLLPLRPAADGTYSQWTRAAVDLGSNAAQARNGTFDFTMLQTPNADRKTTFIPELPDLPAGATIKNIIINAFARVESGTGTIAPMLISNSTESVAADQTLVPSWKCHSQVWGVNPDDSLPWEETDLATLEIGVSS